MSKPLFSDSPRDLLRKTLAQIGGSPLYSDSARDLTRKLLHGLRGSLADTTPGNAPWHSDSPRDLWRKVGAAIRASFPSAEPVTNFDSERDILRKLVKGMGGSPTNFDSVRDLLAKLFARLEAAGITLPLPPVSVTYQPLTWDGSPVYTSVESVFSVTSSITGSYAPGGDLVPTGYNKLEIRRGGAVIHNSAALEIYGNPPSTVIASASASGYTFQVGDEVRLTIGYGGQVWRTPWVALSAV